MDNLNFVIENAVSDANSIFGDAVAVSNIMAYDSIIIEMGTRTFDSYLEYYDYVINNNLKDYYGTYIIQKPSIDDASVYFVNDTILSGGIVWKLTDEDKGTNWYRSISESDGNIVLCKDSYFKTQDGAVQQSFVTDELSVVRKLHRGYSGSSVIGYIKISINMAQLRNALVSSSEYMQFYLVNESESCIYDPQKNSFYNDMDYIRDLVSDNSNIALERNFSGSDYLADWRVVGVYDRSRMLRQQFLGIMIVVMFTFLIAAAAVGVVYIIYRSYNDRIKLLIASMKDVENEVFNEVTGIVGTDEVGKLTTAYNHMINKINVLINDVYKLEAKNKSIEMEKVRAELKYLQSQVDPHFIFNVLNAILVVSVKNGYKEIAPQISGLAKMLRRLLDWSDDSESLSNELDFIKTYLNLEKFRFGDKFNYEINVKNDAEQCNVPKMIVQPLVENACRHGLQGMMGDRMLVIDAELKDNILSVSVRDNGKGIPEEKLREINEGLEKEDFKGHIGMKNVYRRLKLYFGDNADMQIISRENEGTEIVIRIDYK